MSPFLVRRREAPYFGELRRAVENLFKESPCLQQDYCYLSLSDEEAQWKSPGCCGTKGQLPIALRQKRLAALAGGFRKELATR